MLIEASIIVLILVGSGTAQNKAQGPANCEEIGGKLDAVGIRFPSLAAGDSQLIILAASATKAGKKNDKVRLKNASEYLFKYFKIDRDRVITAIGPEPAAQSYLRFYINGALFTELVTWEKSRLCKGIGEQLLSDMDD